MGDSKLLNFLPYASRLILSSTRNKLYIEMQYFMKRTFPKLSLTLFFLTVVAACSLVKDNKQYLIHLEPLDKDPQVLKAALSVINKRLEKVYDGDVVAQVKGNLIVLELGEVVGVKELLSLVLSEGRFNMQEAYTSYETLQRMRVIDPNFSGVGFLHIPSGGASGMIGEAGQYDTAAIMHSATMQAMTKRYVDMQFIWGEEIEDLIIPLYALKVPVVSVLDNRSIKTTSVDLDQRGKESVSIVLKEDFHEAWLTMTRKNIGRPILLRLDGRILSAPLVYGEIPNGVLSISGNLNGKARIFSALISSDVLPTSFSVSSIDPELQHILQRSHPTQSQVDRYNAMRAEYIQYRNDIDSVVLQARAHTNIIPMRRELARIYHEDLRTIVSEVGLTEDQVDLFLDKGSSTLQGFKALLAPTYAVDPSQSLFDSLASIPQADNP